MIVWVAVFAATGRELWKPWAGEITPLAPGGGLSFSLRLKHATKTLLEEGFEYVLYMQVCTVSCISASSQQHAHCRTLFGRLAHDVYLRHIVHIVDIMHIIDTMSGAYEVANNYTTTSCRYRGGALAS